jgi:hypothetical protein
VNAAASAFGEARIDSLARRLGVAPSELLALAGRCARDGARPDARMLRDELARLRAAPAATQAAAALVRLGCGGYAIDDVERMLGITWAKPR